MDSKKDTDRDNIKTEGQDLEVCYVLCVCVCVGVRGENPQGGGFMFSFSLETGCLAAISGKEDLL